MSKVRPLITIGPTIPSFYLENQLDDDNDYGLNLFNLSYPSICTNWISSKPKGSVHGQTRRKTNGRTYMRIKGKQSLLLRVIRTFEEEKLPKKFMEETYEKGLLVKWSPQLEVLSSDGVG
ncbi:hypothetical protein RJ639_015019 [Escallonia herrerae]|uniref:Uncharacterized protein n=1 Tax=Escallonia herrerae TaxID=1293975 RepID=A0AA89APM1_9ASTE|nr:hypothetical protein RJ639_015019 [Escallonia herrerae]